jgi:hypothetical protein
VRSHDAAELRYVTGLMIEWPEDEGDAKKALDAFKKTSLSAELEEDARKWRFLSWARSTEAPARMILRSDSGETRIYSLERTGFWREILTDTAA